MDFLNAQSDYRQVQLAYVQLIGRVSDSCRAAQHGGGARGDPVRSEDAGIECAAGLAAAALVLAGCGKKFDPADGAPPSPQVIDQSNAARVSVDHPEQFPLVAAERIEVADELNVTGTVNPDIAREIPVISLASGRIVDIRARLDDNVKKGDLLLKVQSPDITNAFDTYLKASNDERLAALALARAKDLFAHGAIPQSAVEQAQDAEDDAKADLTAAEQQLDTLGVNKESSVGHREHLRAHLRRHRRAECDQCRRRRSHLFRLADGLHHRRSFRGLDSVQRLRERPPECASGPDRADSLNAYPDVKLTGRISDIGPVLDPNLRTAIVRVEVPNPGNLLRLGMFVTATLASQTKQHPRRRPRHRHPPPARSRLGIRPGRGPSVPAYRGERRPHALRQPSGNPERHPARPAGRRQRHQPRRDAGGAMIRKIVDFALQSRFLVLAIGILLFAWGIVSFHRLPVEAYPDVANNYVDVIAQWPGISAEQIEQQVTIPLETVMNGIPGVAHVRSWSIFGLSTVEMVFGEETTDFENRERVLERLSQVTLPNGVVPQMGTDWSPVGQIYFYTLRSTNPEYDVMNLKSLETWVIEKNLKSVPGVVDTNPFGGPTREYQVRLDPDKLISYGLSIGQVEQQLANNNANAGGSFIQAGAQEINVREVGLVRNIQDIGDTVITTRSGTPLRVKDIAEVSQGPMIRLGQFGDAIPSRRRQARRQRRRGFRHCCCCKRAPTPSRCSRPSTKRSRSSTTQILPTGVKIVPFHRPQRPAPLHHPHRPAQPD